MPNSTSLKVLLIEDDKNIGSLVEMFFDRFKRHTFFTAASCEEAVKIADKNADIRLIWVDGNLTSADGLDTEDLVRQLRELCPFAVLVAISSKPEWQERLLNAGCHHAASKPECFGVPEILKALKLAEPTHSAAPIRTTSA